MVMHQDEVNISTEVANRLIYKQFPKWRHLPVTAVQTSGTVNTIFRVGDALAARFPLVIGDVGEGRRRQESEGNAARELLGRTRFATPEPVALGTPGEGYPGYWSVQTWLPGTVTTEQDPGGSIPFALDLAEFIQGVRAIDTHGRTFSGKGRGGNLQDHDEWMAECFERSKQLLNVEQLQKLWAEFRKLPPNPNKDVMNHGDLIPGNILVDNSRLAGVVDVGGLRAADPALDLVSAWHLLEAAPRTELRDKLQCSDIEWERGKAWAFEQSMGVVWYYADSNPQMSHMGQCTLERILTAETH